MNASNIHSRVSLILIRRRTIISKIDRSSKKYFINFLCKKLKELDTKEFHFVLYTPVVRYFPLKMGGFVFLIPQNFRKVNHFG